MKKNFNFKGICFIDQENIIISDSILVNLTSSETGGFLYSL